MDDHLDTEIISLYKNKDKFSLKPLKDKPYLKVYLENRFNDCSTNYREAVWRILHKIEKRPVCPVCKKAVEFIGKPYFDKTGRTVLGYRKHCSVSCKNNDIKLRKHINETNLKKYGNKCPMHDVNYP